MKFKKLKGIILALLIILVALFTVNALRTKDGFDKYRKELEGTSIREEMIRELEKEYNDLISKNEDSKEADEFMTQIVEEIKNKNWDLDTKPVVPKTNSN